MKSIKIIVLMIFISLKLGNHCFTHLPLTRQATQPQTHAKEQNACAIKKQTSRKMIDQSKRTDLVQKVRGDIDYKAAAGLYKEKTGRDIHWRYFYKFLRGERKIEGIKPGSHQPLDMYEAVVDAIKKREMEAEKMTVKAAEILERLAA